MEQYKITMKILPIAKECQYMNTLQIYRMSHKSEAIGELCYLAKYEKM
jgi:hypothetical protein